MSTMTLNTLLLAMMAPAAMSQSFDPLNYYSTKTQQLGGNSPWFPGPSLSGIPYEVPTNCTIDQAAFVSRHGSRYPDASAYYQWTNLSAKIQAADFVATGALSFLPTWKPVLSNPAQQLSAESIGGWRELMEMGTAYRWRYPGFYTDNTNFTLWANQYPAAPRVVDSARLWARGFLGPNATADGMVIVLPSTGTGVVGNSLGPSDSCPTYNDNGGGAYATNWSNTYLPPITARINALLSPDSTLNFTTSDVSIMPYLCGFETQITGTQSPWCSVFTDEELALYNYAQSIRYYYGNGPGSGGNGTLMLSVLSAIVSRLQDGPNATYTNSAGAPFHPGPLAAMFTNDGQLSQLVSELGVYDDVLPLPDTYMPPFQKYIASNFVTMRGTVGFERLTCTNPNATVAAPGWAATDAWGNPTSRVQAGAGTSQYVRITLNDAVYPVVGCASGPGASCPLSEYAGIVAGKMAKAGSLRSRCNITNKTEPVLETATFLKDDALPWQIVVRP